MKKWFIASVFLLSCYSLFSQTKVAGGYFPYYRTTTGTNFAAYNYLYYSFVYPLDFGDIELGDNNVKAFNDFKTATASLSAKRMISVGSKNCANMAKNATARKNFARNLRIFCRTHDMDGIDMDWEAIDNLADMSNFTSLMKEIRAEIDSTSLEFIITIGIGNYWMQWYDNDVLKQSDFLQIMVYDQTGSWSTSPYGNHASMDHFIQAGNYWKNRGFSPDKLVLGMPYYGYKFASTAGGLAPAVTYAEILSQFPNAKAADNNLINTTGYYWFNGVDLVKQKVDYAITQGFRGVFVWEITQDNLTHPLSLTKALSESIATNTTELKADYSEISFFPNPAKELVVIQSSKPLGNIAIYSVLGVEVFRQFSRETRTEIQLENLKGLYFIRVNESFTGKLVVQ